MNERIKQLAEQCYETGPIGRDGWPEYSRLNEQKFAELIVEECMNAIYNIDDLGGYQFKAATAVKEHFGVE